MSAQAVEHDVTLKARLESRPRRAGPVKPKNDVAPILRRLVSYMLRDEGQRRFKIAAGVQIAALVALVLVPFCTGQGINAVTSGSNDALQLALWSSAAIVLTIIYFGLSAYAERIFARLATTGLYNLQRELFEHIQTLSLSFFDRQPLGELMSRVTNDTETVSLFYESAIGPLLRSLIQIALLIGIMLLINWQLTLVALLIIPVILVTTLTVQRVATPAFDQLQKEIGELSGFQEETITGQKVVVANRRQTWASDANALEAGDVYEVGSRAYFAAIIQFPLTTSFSMVNIVLVLIYGAFMVIYGETTLGVVVAFMTYVAMLSTPLSDIASLLSTALSAISGGRRVFSILDEQPTVTDAPDATTFDFKGGCVQFEDVDFSYVPGRKILKHNTFEAEPGQKIGICGPTGAGKSTIINILTRYYDIDSGAIVIDGQNISKLTQTSLRQQIGVVLQEAFLFSDTVMNNLKYAREGATDEECIAAAKDANAHEFIMQLPQGYDTVMTERGSNLSQGQRQMITIARAMVANPKILVLDEATSNVDTRTEKLIQQGLQKLMSGRTSFVIAHRLSTIRDSNQILVVNGGEIVEHGTHEALMAAHGFYYTLYMSQFKGKAPAGAAAGVAQFAST